MFEYRLRRLRDTALRLKWWIALVMVVSVAAGVAATRLVTPVFTASATVLVARNGADAERGPIRESQVLETPGWVDVLRSNRVVDSTVITSRYHIRAGSKEAAALLDSARTREEYRSGAFRLVTDADGASYRLLAASDTVLEQGTLPDSVGRTIGLVWYVPRRTGAGEYRFYLERLRDAAQELRDQVVTTAPERAQFVSVELTGIDPSRTAATLNVWLDEFVRVAGDLKKKRATEYQSILDEQLALAQDRLRSAETSLENLRASAITAPSSGGPIAGGLEATRDPLMKEYLDNRLKLDEVRRDRSALQAMLRDPETMTVERLTALSGVATGNEALRSALAELATNEAKLRTARQFYGEEHASVRDLVQAIGVLRRQTLPQLARGALDQLAFREQSLASSVSAYSSELRRVPERSIEEARRRREVAVAEELYTSVLARYNEVRLGQAAEGADISVFDYARAPKSPSSNPRLRVAFGGLVGGVALAALLVLVADRRDPRVRYVEQITNDMRLDVLGFVPKMPTSASPDPLMAAQAVESFRSLRLRLQHDMPNGVAVRVVISSPGIGDGKSLVSQNLAVSFAEAGFRTLLVDGDVRRGQQHSLFGVTQHPGLTEVLEGQVEWEQAVVPAGPANLFLLPCGTRHRRVPELLDRDRLTQLFDAMRDGYDVVIIDAAPLGAGVDAFALGVAAGTMALVFRLDHTDARMAESRLEVLDRLPIRVPGAILNGVVAKGAFQYYAYYQEYLDPEPTAPPRNVRRARVTPTKVG